MTTDTDKINMAATLNEFARTIRYRSASAVVHVVNSVEHPSPPAPAWFIPATADVYVHLDAAGYKASIGDKEMAVIKGLVCHELAHSRWSGWMDDVKIPKNVLGTVTLFEEMRIENRAVDADRPVGLFIRAALPLAIGETRDVSSNRSSVARLWALGYGRALTTITTHGDVEWIDQAARTLLGDDDVDYLRDILQEAIALQMPARVDRMLDLAAQWVELVGDADAPSCNHGTPDEDGLGELGEAGDDADARHSDDDVISDILDSVDGKTTEDDDTDLNPGDVAMIVDEVVKMAKAISADWAMADKLDMAEPTAMAHEVFGKKSTSSGMRPHPAGPAEFKEIARTSKALEAMSIPAVTKVPAMNMVPPGRLRGREALRASAERATGTMTTAKPWRSTKRTHTHVKPIVIGIATDTSGSMKWSERSVAQFAYVWTHAGQRVGARTAAVTFGDRAEAIARPGEIMPNLLVRHANGGSERADDALAALDGVLHLSTQNNAAKLLIVVSDAMFVIAYETKRVVRRMREMRDAGTTILWVTNDDKERLPGIGKVATVVHTKRDEDAFKALQDAAIAALNELTR